MSVPDQVPKTELVVSGASVTQFDFDFYAPNTANVYVLVDSSAVSSGWVVSGNEGGSGFVKFGSPVVMGATVTIYRSTPMEQSVDLGQGDTFYPQVITECMDNVVMGMQEMRGGVVNTPGSYPASAGYAVSAGSAVSAGFATTADYANSAGLAFALDPTAVAASATHATNADTATAANGAAYAASAGEAAVYGGTVGYAVSAGTAGGAGIASALTSDAKTDILSSAGGKYDGPFAVITDSEEGTAGCRPGYVYAGGSHILVSGFDSDAISFADGDTLYLTLSSGTSVISGLATSPSGHNPDTVLVRLANNEGGTVKQLQFGDITTIPWGLGGSGTASAYAVQISSGYSASTPGIVFANTSMTNNNPAGAEACITTNDNPWITYAKVPQGGPSGGWAPDGDSSRGIFNNGIYGCSYTMTVSSGAIIKLSGSLPQTVYFLGFNTGS